MIIYSDSLKNINTEKLQGFFVDWPNPPSPEIFLQLLNNSDYAVIAIDDNNGNVVGFITCITDNVLTAYIPLLEVLPMYQKSGIGANLIRMVFEKFRHLYKIDLCCDQELQDYYSRFGMIKVFGMTRVNYTNQSGHDYGMTGGG
jgi:ribosomal protein S18 acetylase RimI-like enzyme